MPSSAAASANSNGSSGAGGGKAGGGGAPEHLPSTITPLDLKRLSKSEKLRLLQSAKASHARRPDLLFFLVTDLLSLGARSFEAGELHDLYEQALVASLECGKTESARLYLQLLEKRFGRRSARVQHLRGLCLEAEGNTAEAREVYAQTLRECPTDAFVIKRLSAIYKGEGRYAEAIRVLTEDRVYIDDEAEDEAVSAAVSEADKVKGGDVSAAAARREVRRLKFLQLHRGDSEQVYRELSNLYYMSGNMERAIFYTEEEILFSPLSYYLHTRLGELYYHERDYQRSAIEFSQSLLLNPNTNNARAAYGLRQAAGELLRRHHNGSAKLQTEKELKQAQDLHAYATDTLHTMYKGSPLLSVLDALPPAAA